MVIVPNESYWENSALQDKNNKRRNRKQNLKNNTQINQKVFLYNM